MEAYRLRVTEKKILKRKLGLRDREKERGGLIKVHNKELHNLYCSLIILG
jgi:hypothetical protein